MIRFTPALFAVALLGCRTDTSANDVVGLQSDLAEFTARVEALEADVRAKDQTIAALTARVDTHDADLAAVDDELVALSAVDLTETLEAIDAVDARVETLEDTDFATETWVAAQGHATETWVADQGYAAQTALTALDARVGTNETATSANADLIVGNTTAIAGNSASISANAQAIATGSAALSGVTTEVGTLSSGLSAAVDEAARIDAALIATNAALDTLTSTVDTQSTALSALDGDVDSLQGLAAAAGARVSVVEEDLADVVANALALQQDVELNTAGVSSAAQGVLDNAGALSSATSTLSEQQQQIDGVDDDLALVSADLEAVAAAQTASGGDLDSVLDRVDLLEIYTHTEWVAADTSVGTDNGPIQEMRFDFDKQLDASMLLVQYDDNLRTNGGGSGCRWEVRFNGASCNSPGRVVGDVYVNGQNSHKQHAVVGYCRSTASGRLVAGDVTVSVHVMPSPNYSGSDCHTGWQGDQLGVLRATEIPDLAL